MIIGIDLGTSYCTAGFVNAERIPTLVGDAKTPGQFRTPSLLALSDQCCFVGKRAEEYLLDGLTRSFVRYPKWELGFAKSLISDSQKRKWSAEAILAVLFSKLRTDFLASGNGSVDGAIVAVPANFNDQQRRAVRHVGELIGMPIVSLVDAPVAAVRFLVEPRTQPQSILVCDFGSGSFEVSAIRYSDQELSVLATDAALELGTRTLREELTTHFTSRLGSLAKEKESIVQQQLLSIAEQAMVSLCQEDKVVVSNKHFVAGFPIDTSINRRYFSQALDPFADHCVQKALECIGSIDLDVTAFDRIVLIGGGCLIPGLVQRFCEGLRVQQDRIMVKQQLDAVVYGTSLLADEGLSEKSFMRRTHAASAFDLGIRIRDPRTQKTAIYKLVKRNTSLPAKASKVFKTSRLDQERMIIEVVQVKGSAGSAISLGNFSFGPLNPTTEGHPIEITIACNGEGLVQVSAKDLVGGREIQHHVTPVATDLAPTNSRDEMATSEYDRIVVDWAIANLQT